MKKIALAGIITAAALTGAIVGIPAAQAYEPDAAKCAVIVRVYGGTCDEQLDAALDRVHAKALRQEQATRAAGVALLDVADVEALDAKIKAKKDEKAAAEEIE